MRVIVHLLEQAGYVTREEDFTVWCVLHIFMARDEFQAALGRQDDRTQEVMGRFLDQLPRYGRGSRNEVNLLETAHLIGVDVAEFCAAQSRPAAPLQNRQCAQTRLRRP